MLIRHSALYLSGRLIPGAVSLVALAVYTRMLGAAEYGRYALVSASIGIVNAVAFQWLTLSLLRFLPARAVDDRRSLMSTALGGYLSVLLVTLGTSLVLIAVRPASVPLWAVALVALGACAQAWFDMNLQIANAGLAPIRYGLLTSLRALAALALSVMLIRAGLGAAGVVTGMVVSLFVTPIPVLREWSGAAPSLKDRVMLRQLARYGLPLIVTYAMALVLDLSDRYLIAWFMDAGAVGAYAAAYDLSQQSLGALIGVVHLASFPLAVRAFEGAGVEGAQQQMRRNLVALSAIAMPAAAGLSCLSGNIAFTFLGAGVRSSQPIIPVIAVAALIWGLKAYYVDYAYQLTGRMTAQWLPFASAVAVNLGLNLAVIPRFGLMGAAGSTLAGYVVGALVSWRMANRIFAFPAIAPDVWKVVGASVVMALAVSFMRGGRGPAWLAAQIASGAVVYLGLLLITNVGDVRSKLLAFVEQRRKLR